MAKYRIKYNMPGATVQHYLCRYCPRTQQVPHTPEAYAARYAATFTSVAKAQAFIALNGGNGYGMEPAWCEIVPAPVLLPQHAFPCTKPQRC